MSIEAEGEGEREKWGKVQKYKKQLNGCSVNVKPTFL